MQVRACKRLVAGCLLGLTLCAATPARTEPSARKRVGGKTAGRAADVQQPVGVDPQAARAIRLLQGSVVEPAEYPNTMDGFQRYLSSSGVRGVTAAELTAPHHIAVAKRLGYSSFLPQQAWWPRGAALALLAAAVRESAGRGVHVRNWWRPKDYNADPLVKGASASDHLTAHAVDLDYGSDAAQQQAEAYLRVLHKRAPWLHMSLGLGSRTTHVGLLSPLGHREWSYGHKETAKTSAAAHDKKHKGGTAAAASHQRARGKRDGRESTRAAKAITNKASQRNGPRP